MKNKFLQRNQMIILASLLLVISFANYYNYYSPKKEKVMEDFSQLTDDEKEYYVRHKKIVSFNDGEKYDESGKLIAEDLSKDDIINGSNYLKFAVAQDGQLVKWNKNQITYSIDDKTGYKATIERAIETYNSLFNDYFVLEKSNNDMADIQFVVKDKFDSNERSREEFMCGLTDISYSEEDNYISNAKVYLLSKNPQNKKPVSEDMMYATVLHEIGHALGITGHSENKYDIMYKSLKNNDIKLSQRDRVTIKMLYADNEKVIKKQTRHAKREKVSEARRYSDNSTSSNETVALVNLAKAYFESGENEKALNTFKKAMRKDSKNPYVYKSMAECYYYSKKYESALKFFNIAKDLTTDISEINELNNTIGVTYAKMEDFENAYKYFKEAYYANKNSLEVAQNILACCMKLNKKQEILSIVNLMDNNTIKNDKFVQRMYNWAKN